MNKTTLLTLLLVTICIVFILLFVFFKAELPNRHNNGFSRKWISKDINIKKQKQFDLPLHKICGSTDESIYFSVPNPQWIIKIDKSLNSIDTIFFPINLNNTILKFNSLNVDFPRVYFFANNARSIFKGFISNKSVTNIEKYSTKNIFTREAYISPTNIILRIFDSLQNKQVFQIINPLTGNIIRQSDIITIQNDKGFSSDGYLKYDNFTNRIIYLSRFQNKFYCLDTSLKLVYVSKTIDTISANNIQMKEIIEENESTIKPSNSRITINKNCCTNNGLLFALSNLKADNETLAHFNENTTIDIYQIKDGTYEGSFSIKDLPNKKIKSFQILNNNLTVLDTDNNVSNYFINFDKSNLASHQSIK